MAQPIQVCSLRRVPEGLTTAATHFALQERSSNAGAKDEEDRLDFPIQRMWKPGRELRIRFIDGTPTLQDKIRAYANEWPRYANIKFTWVDSGDSEIRISAGDNHEFGHALGCHHEHQSPAAGIPWNEAAVLEYYKRTNGWDEAMFRHSLLVKYPASETKFSTFDEDPPLTSQELTKRANFAKEFPVPPIVTVGLNYIDADREHNVGVQAAGDQVATSSAEVALSHWSDTKAYGMGCTRGTFAVDDPDIQVGEFATSEDHPWSEPKQKTSQRVVIWYETLDIGSGQWWRTTALAENVTAESFDLSVETWGDSVLYVASVTWLAHQENRRSLTSGTFSTGDVRNERLPQLET